MAKNPQSAVVPLPVAPPGKRIGARRRSEIPAEILRQLNHGVIEAASLSETLAVDFAVLLEHAVPAIRPTSVEQMAAAAKDGITGRMRLAGELLLRDVGEQCVGELVASRSDTVRGWAAYVVAAIPGLELAERLSFMRPLADDANSGVREWAWIALRQRLLDELPEALRLLEPWTADPSANIRRYATESTRPRGVWCVHSKVLQEQPQLGLPLLEPLRADPAKYVQDSVSNWLNDASKNRPDWVAGLCRQWLADRPAPATIRICRRAQRSLPDA